MNDQSFDPNRAARVVLRSAATAALATLSPDGAPFASFVTVGTDVDGAPILLLSRLAAHTHNIEADERCSLLLVAPGGEGGDPLSGNRLTVVGRLRSVTRDDPRHPRLRGRFLARHPEAEGYCEFADFDFFRLEVGTAHLVAGFGRIHTIDGSHLVMPAEEAHAFVKAEAGAVSHMNLDHADAVGLYATQLLGRRPGAWKVVAIDPDGMDLADGQSVARLAFPERQLNPMDLRTALKRLADEARPAG